jgi:hypothetical protein
MEHKSEDTQCPQECNVFIRVAKKEQKQRRIAEKWKYKPSIEEVDDEEAYIH